MTNNEIQDNMLRMVHHIFSTIVQLLFVKLHIQISNLSDVTSYRTNENQAVLLFCHLSIIASLLIEC